ncbi:hypothetical protein BGX34_009734 [Mortierella sp. NVP85]|nr:hypothetical protein BGX34_009734 [Mortierella sp. NVP85]
MTDTLKTPRRQRAQQKPTQGSYKGYKGHQGQQGHQGYVQLLQPQPVSTVQGLSLSAPKSPLEIEEIVNEIVLYLDKRSLHCCVSVSRVFYRASIRVLWTSVHWKNFAHPDIFLSEFDRYGRYIVELHDNHNADLARIARICTNLYELRLNWTSPTDEKLEDVVRSSPKISFLSLYSCHFLSTKSLLYIARLSRLRRLELRNMVKMDGPSLVVLLKSCPLLEYLALEDVRLNRTTLDSLGTTPLKITTLALTRSSPTGSLVQNILNNSPDIKEMSLARNVHSSLSMDNLLPHQNVYRHLSNLNLESCKLISSETILAIIQASFELERVNLSGTHVDDEALEILAVQCTKLTSLNIALCPIITDQGLLRALGNCKGLSFLDISTMDTLSAAIFKRDASWGCTDLETLIMMGIDMTQPMSPQMNHAMMFNQLSCLERLRDLTIGSASLELQLEAGLTKMEKLCNLESFRIQKLQSALEDDEVRWLIDAWPKLKRARFGSGSLSQPWLRYFRRQRPQLALC